MFGVSTFINYTIAVAVWTRFCFHVFPHVELCNLRRIPQRYLYLLVGLAGEALDHADGSV